tara:strand:+ start:1272 stop:1772 length:501 start_codon:yes stop_codon:yes gene_type:complete
MAIVTTIGGTTTNSYITVAEYEAFWTERNVTIGGSTSSKESELVKSADYINRAYDFIGEQQYRYQTMAWPRLTGIMLVKDWPIDPDTVPQDIKDAQAELAYLINQGATPFATVEGGAKVREKNKAGPVETDVEYTNFRETPRFVAIEGLVSPYTVYGGAQIKVIRG